MAGFIEGVDPELEILSTQIFHRTTHLITVQAHQRGRPAPSLRPPNPTAWLPRHSVRLAEALQNRQRQLRGVLQ